MCDDFGAACKHFLNTYLCCCFDVSENEFEDTTNEQTSLLQSTGVPVRLQMGEESPSIVLTERIERPKQDRTPCDPKSAGRSIDEIEEQLGGYAKLLAEALGSKEWKLPVETVEVLKQEWGKVCLALNAPAKFPKSLGRKVDWLDFTCGEVIKLANRQPIITVPGCLNTTVDVTIKSSANSSTSEATRINDELNKNKDPNKVGLLMEMLRQRLKVSVKTATHVYDTLRDNPEQLCSVLGVNNLDESCEVQISVLSADEHGGYPPAKASFTLKDSKIGTVVLKSRGGAVDKLVTDACSLINDQCGGISIGGSTKVKLPCYRQELTKEGWLISEFISGTPGSEVLGDLGTITQPFEELAGTLKFKGIDPQKAQSSLQALELFARCIGLRDLHIENFVFKDGEAIPIDLEVFNIGDEGITELFCTLPKCPIQDLKTQKLLKQIREKFKQTTRRFVPLATGIWAGLIGQPVFKKTSLAEEDSPYQQVQLHLKKIERLVTEAGYEVVDQNLLWQYVAESLEADKIVPFFVFNDDFVCVGAKAEKKFAFAIRKK